MQNYQTVQLELLKGIDSEAMELKQLVKWGKAMLTLLRKSKQYLRDDANNKYWQSVKAQCTSNLSEIASSLPGILADPELGTWELMAAFDLVSSATIAFQEEAKLDETVESYTITDIFSAERIAKLNELVNS